MKLLRFFIVVGALLGTIITAFAALPPDVMRPPAPRVRATGTLAPGPAGTPPAASPNPVRTPGLLQRLPALPPMPHSGGRLRRPRSATGATITVATVSGCSTTVGTVYNQNCQIAWNGTSLSAGTHQDYVYTPATTTPATVGATYTATTGSLNTLTLATTGTYILATYNVTTTTWEAVAYIIAGSASTIGTYSDSFLSVAANQFVANNSKTIYISTNALTPTDSYVYTVEYTSIGAQSSVCVAYFPTNTSSPTAPALCDASRSPGQTAPGGTFTAAWGLSSSLAPGTYSIALYDKTSGTRLGQTQVALTKNGATAVWSLAPSGTGVNPSPAPAPAGTPTVKFAYNGSSDVSDGGVVASATGLLASTAYTEAISDPNGTVVFKGTTSSSAAGALSVTFPFTQAQSPVNYLGKTYTITALQSGSTTVPASAAFTIVGYSAYVQFTNPLGTAEDITSGSVTTGIKYTNNSDAVYGTGHGDPITHIQSLTVSPFSGVALNGNTYPTSQVITDSDGQSWTVTLTCTGGCGGGAGNKTFLFDLVPNTAGQALKVGSTLTIPSVTVTTSGRCGVPGCSITTTILPQDGLTWSSTTSGATNDIFFSETSGVTYAGTAHVVLAGYRNASGLTLAQDAHGYTTRFNQAFYAATQPAALASGTQDEFDFQLNNTSGGSAVTIQNFELSFPTSFQVSSAAIDFGKTGTPANASSYAIVTCPAGTPSNVLCIQANGANTGLSPGLTQHAYVSLNAPSLSFSYTDIAVTAYSQANFAFSADAASNTVFVGASNPLTVDSLALGSYSLDATLITPLFNPQTVGSSGTYNVAFSLQNASQTSSPFPDYLDLVVVDLPSANTLSNIAVSTPGWTYLGSTTPAGKVRYWFGLCAGQFNIAAPPANGTPSCGSVLEQNSLSPGGTTNGTLNVSAKVTTGAAGSITATAYAHGANVGGWSSGTNFNLTVSAVAAAVGFYKVGTYNSPALVATNTEPQVGADSNSVNGNSYVYQIQNSGANPITNATITIPHLDTTGASGADSSGQNWQITTGTPPAVTGTSYGCSVSSYTNPTSSVDGSIVIGGGSCSIPTNSTLYIQFNAFAPYRVNSTYSFPATVNSPSNIAASEAWFSDSLVKIVLSGSINIDLPPNYGSSPGQSSPVSTGCGLCSFSTNFVALGAYANNTTSTFGDLIRVSVYTDATNPIGWSLYVVADTNPARTPSTPTNELLAFTDSAHSSSPNPGMNFSNTSATVIPTSGNGLLLADVGSGTTARRIPFDVVTSYQLSIGTEALTAHTVNLTFTWISN